MTPYRVLLFDDDRFFLDVNGDFLRSRGFEVDVAESAQRALEIYQADRYRLVVADLVIPGVDGIELVERIREINPTQDIIVVTGSDDVRTAVRAMRLGVYDYLVKPIDREELMMLIDRLQERTTLYDEHARLLNENTEYAEMQQTFGKALRVMQSLDFGTVCERVLETLAEAAIAQGAILWLTRDEREELLMYGYRGLVDVGAVPNELTLNGEELNEAMQAGVPAFADRDLSRPRVIKAPAASLVVPLRRDGRILGVVQLTDKLGGSFAMRDATRVKVIAEAASTAIAHAKRFSQLERIRRRDTVTNTHTMTYFVDYLGRELHRARRYRRSFALIEVALDNVVALRHALQPEVFREMLRHVALVISNLLSNTDVLARVDDDQMFLLLPESGFLRGLSFARAARDAIFQSPFIADIDRQHPIQLSCGPAAFPRDGDDVGRLFAACRRRLDEARRSIFRRLHLEGAEFWDAIDLLIGESSNYQGDEVRLSRVLGGTEDRRGLTRHLVFSSGSVERLHRELIAEASYQGHSGGWLVLGSSWGDSSTELIAAVQRLGALKLKSTILGSRIAEHLRCEGQLSVIRSSEDTFRERDVMLMLCEHSAYGFASRRREDGECFGFHTADWTLVEGLINQFEAAFGLREGG